MSGPLIGPAEPPALHVMTYNVRRRLGALTWPPADRWSRRRPRLAALLADERPTIVGAQEVLPDQAEVIRDALGPAYRFLGHGRAPGPRGEACPVFYDHTRLSLRDWRQVALSERPDEPGSVSWGSVFPRVYVWATFVDRVTSRELTVVNTHLDAFSSRARRRSAEQLHRVVAGMPGTVVLLGDLNAEPGSAPWRSLMRDRTLDDAWRRAERRLSPEWGTFGGYRRPRAGRRLDALLVSPHVRVHSVAVNARRVDGGWPSDHLPVHALVSLPEPPGAS
ncbi:endonuclease/exonuclease/phosphatase family protein [Microbacterium sp. 179-I 3D3 NHS]|uniref:endonuclease/exonuclease/phosphatase family protein n=1 Tax=Microbacterium sp. 179-I 3D3 NHS TaxID=3142382 RepID=UPI0039A0A909